MTTEPLHDSAGNKAHIGPFAIFMLLLLVPDLVTACGIQLSAADIPWYLTTRQIWLYPLQTVACAGALICWRRHYTFRPFVGLPLAALLGVAGIAVWIAPGWLFQTLKLNDGWWKYFGLAARTDGFDPTGIHPEHAIAYYAILAMRFLRLIVVVPLVEEIFWRGFLMRFFVDPDGDFWKVPFGTHNRLSLFAVSGLFVLAHSPVDYAAATIYALLTYWLAVKTKSLAACVLMHAVANLLLGIYVMNTGQWAYW